MSARETRPAFPVSSTGTSTAPLSPVNALNSSNSAITTQLFSSGVMPEIRRSKEAGPVCARLTPWIAAWPELEVVEDAGYADAVRRRTRDDDRQ